MKARERKEKKLEREAALREKKKLESKIKIEKLNPDR
jgi:hypothetical protein